MIKHGKRFGSGVVDSFGHATGIRRTDISATVLHEAVEVEVERASDT
jgi:hypothetical protein